MSCDQVPFSIAKKATETIFGRKDQQQLLSLLVCVCNYAFHKLLLHLGVALVVASPSKHIATKSSSHQHL